MAKGRANPALVIWIADVWFNRPEVEELANVGHKVYRFSGAATAEEPDLIIHPAAHGWHESMFESPYLKAALTAGRKRHRSRKKTA